MLYIKASLEFRTAYISPKGVMLINNVIKSLFDINELVYEVNH